MMSRKPSLYWRTLTRLKPEQIFWRAARGLPRIPRRVPPFPGVRAFRRPAVSFLRKPASFDGVSGFELLNEKRVVDLASKWRAAQASRLWNYNLHYFDFLFGRRLPSAPEGALLIDRWVRANPVDSSPGWEPYPTSLRVINWVKWHLTVAPLSREALSSLWLQTWYLSRRLERDLLANHYLENLRALAAAALFFDGGAAARMYRTVCRKFEQQIAEQILADGGHFERSPMYHALILEGLLDSINLHRACSGETPPLLGNVAARMLVWMKAMTHPDGELAFFNDAGLGVASRWSELKNYAESLGVPAAADSSEKSQLTVMRASGFFRVNKPLVSLFADVGSLGPDYQPGHAHAETLACELSVKGQRVLVNTGTSLYQDRARRELERSTAAHNTVVLDGQSSSEMWGAFRVGRRARVVAMDATLSDTEVRVEATHDGYRHNCRVAHKRVWTLDDRMLIVEDHLAGHGRHRVEIFWHLHPECVLTWIEGSGYSIFGHNGAGLADLICPPGTSWGSEQYEYCSKFGLRTPAECVVIRYEGELPARFVSKFMFRL